MDGGYAEKAVEAGTGAPAGPEGAATPPASCISTQVKFVQRSCQSQLISHLSYHLKFDYLCMDGYQVGGRPRRGRMSCREHRNVHSFLAACSPGGSSTITST